MLNIFGFIPFCWFKPFKLNENIIFWVRKGTGVCLYSKEREREEIWHFRERERGNMASSYICNLHEFK